MKQAFPEALVENFQTYLTYAADLPDTNDKHVFAAALAARADVLITENIKDFPTNILGEYNMELRTADAFMADTATLDLPKSAAAVNRMRRRLKNPSYTPKKLLAKMDQHGLILTVDALKDFQDVM